MRPPYTPSDLTSAAVDALLWCVIAAACGFAIVFF